MSTAPPPTEDMAARFPYWVPLLACLPLLAAILTTAWISDDAEITFRVIENFHGGHGLTWNTAERVQVYSHPLWMLLLLVLYLPLPELYFLPMFLGAGLTMGAVWLVLRGATTVLALVLGGGLLALSSAFVDYATSGLENPLGYFLLVLFFLQASRFDGKEKDLLFAFILAGLLPLVRLDLALIALPLVLMLISRGVKWIRLGKTMALFFLAGIPLVTWTLFSFFYYGAIFPNTAYAKLGHGISSWELRRQGFFYFFDSLLRDPITLLTLGITCVLVFPGKAKGPDGALLIGILLYLVYVWNMGGDFMAGRFLAIPYLGAVLLLIRNLPSQKPVGVVSAAILLLVGVANPRGILWDRTLSSPDFQLEQAVGKFRVTNERHFHSPFTGLFRVGGERFQNLIGEAAPEYNQTPKVLSWELTGRPVRRHGPAAHQVEIYAITDPLLARMPGIDNPDWMHGHWHRVIPQGYIESILFDENRIVDPAVAAVYDHVRLASRGSIFSRERLVGLLTAPANHRRFPREDWERYRRPTGEIGEYAQFVVHRVHVRAAHLNASPDPVLMPMEDNLHLPILLYLEEGSTGNQSIRISVSEERPYNVWLYDGIHEVESLTIESSHDQEGEHPSLWIEPSDVNFDRIGIYTTGDRAPFSIWGIELVGVD